MVMPHLIGFVGCEYNSQSSQSCAVESAVGDYEKVCPQATPERVACCSKNNMQFIFIELHASTSMSLSDVICKFVSSCSALAIVSAEVLDILDS